MGGRDHATGRGALAVCYVAQGSPWSVRKRDDRFGEVLLGTSTRGAQ